MEVLFPIIKYSTLFISCFYGYEKLIKKKLCLYNLLDIFVAILFGTGLFYITEYLRLLVPICLLLISITYLYIRYRKPLLDSVVICTISCGITIFIMTLSTVLSIPLNMLTFYLVSNEFIRNVITTVVLSIFQLFLMILLFKIKRFKSGVSLRNKDGIVDLLLLLSILAIFLMTLFYTKDIAHSPTEIIVLTIAFCGLALIMWWKKHITDNYHRQLYIRNETLYEERIQEYEKERVELVRQNNELSKIIHRDNKLIPAMATAVRGLLSETEHSDEIKSLLNQLEGLSVEHKELIETFQTKNDNLPRTNNLSIDAVIRFLASKAAQNNICIDFEMDNETIQIILDKINNMTELNTILCDLGENAIIATKELSCGKILISFGLIDNFTPYICFYDNGFPFEEKVVANMGKKRITTHQMDGGSGIGLMTLFEILQKYKASYCLNECPNKEGFTKCVEIVFDDFCNVRVLTKRENIKKICASRSDFFTNLT